MIELSINAGQFDVVSDEPIDKSKADTTEDVFRTVEAQAPKSNIFTLAQGIADRGYRYRILRRASSVI